MQILRGNKQIRESGIPPKLLHNKLNSFRLSILIFLRNLQANPTRSRPLAQLKHALTKMNEWHTNYVVTNSASSIHRALSNELQLSPLLHSESN